MTTSSRNLRFRLVESAKVGRRRFFEWLKSDRYSRPARDDMDRKLEAYLPSKGYFVEAGGFDGFTASNTYYLERMKGWSGVIIEPSPWDYRRCVRLRPRSLVFNCALVSADDPRSSVELRYAGDLSFVRGAYTAEREVERMELTRRFREPSPITVPARTLTSVLDEAGAGSIDFLSLDVEGYETEVLRGLDLARYSPAIMLIECQTPAARTCVETLLWPRYRLADQISRHDFVFRNASEPCGADR